MTAPLANCISADFVERPLWLDDVIFGMQARRAPPSFVDVLVIGGGYTGLSAAAATAAAGRSTCVIEAASLGFGCSARNGGQIATSIKPSLSALTRRFGDGPARAILQEGIDALEGLRELVAVRGLDCDWQDNGRYCAAHTVKHFDALVSLAQRHSCELDIPFAVISRAEQHRELGSERYVGGVCYPRHASVHPAKLLRALHEMAIAAGVDYVEACAAQDISAEKSGFVVRTSAGSVRARHVIIATNGYTGTFSPWHRRRVIPIRSNIIATERLPLAVMDTLLPTRRNVVDTRKLAVYFRPSPDHTRIVFGGRAALLDVPASVSVPRLLSWLRRLFPVLGETRISHSWSGSVAYTFDELPHIGCHRGIHYCMGYCGSGVSLSIHFGRKIALQVLGQSTGRTALDDMPFRTRPLYSGYPWFLAPSILTFRTLDALHL